MRSTISYGVLALLLASIGCESAPAPVTTAEDVVATDAWWDNPGLIKTNLAAVGASPVMNEYTLATARQTSEVDGRAKIAAALKAKIESLVENWSKEVGDLAKGPASFTSLVNNESLVRQYTDTVLQGAMAHKYQRVGNTMYCLVVLQDAGKWTENVLQDVQDQALADETFWKSEVMKEDFRKRMDALKGREVEKSKADQRTILEAAPSNG
jgi:hypothetical protein